MANTRQADVVSELLELADTFDYGTPVGWTDANAVVLRRAAKEIEFLRARIVRLEGLS